MIIGQGAEATLVKNEDLVVKQRLRKGYRLAELDDKLRKSRTKREAKVISTLSQAGVLVPSLIGMNDSSMEVSMSLVSGDKVRDVLDSKVSLGEEIGELVGSVHKCGIIHQDLTTSNMILSEEGVVLIDFGLSFFSDKIEDRAVDLHLLERGLEAKHPIVHDEVWSLVKRGYSSVCSDFEEVFTRLKQVEGRGRYK